MELEINLIKGGTAYDCVICSDLLNCTVIGDTTVLHQPYYVYTIIYCALHICILSGAFLLKVMHKLHHYL